MRKWHRWIGLVAAVFFIVTAFTGIWLECVRFFGEDEALREKVRDLASKHTAKARAFAIEEKLSAARAAVAAKFPDAPLDKIQLQLKGDEPMATFFLGSKDGRRVVVNPLTSIHGQNVALFLCLPSARTEGDFLIARPWCNHALFFRPASTAKTVLARRCECEVQMIRGQAHARFGSVALGKRYWI